MDITVIIPAHNRKWSLSKAIESCRGYDKLAIQLIVVDDGSTDGTWEMLTLLKDIEIYREQNWGKPWAVNMAFSHAKGKYIKFLDSDDWLMPGSLQEQFDLAETQNADLIVSGYHLFNDSGLLTTQKWVRSDDFIAQNLGECDSSHYSAFLFKRIFIEEIPHRTSFASADFASRDDRCFMLEAALKEPVIAVMETPALCHLHHNNNRLQFKTNMAMVCTNYQHLLIYKNVLRQLKESDRLTSRRIKAAENVLWPLCHWIAKTDIHEAALMLNWMKELDPEFKIPGSGLLSLMYNTIGFKTTERLLKLRRLVKHG